MKVRVKPSLVQIALLVAVLLPAIYTGAQPVTQVAAGTYHSLFLKSDGSLWAMGNNQSGQLGDGTYNYSTNQPEQIVASNVTAIAAGTYQSLFLKIDGSLWAMGDNSFGELGLGSISGTNRPTLVVASNVTAIAAAYREEGNTHSLFLKSDGSLWGMGDNHYGQLGLNSISKTNRPVLIIASNVTAIAAGGLHSLFLKNDGSLWAMGANQSGQLGDGTHNYSTNQPEQIAASNVIAIAAGKLHSLFLKNDGSLWGMGANNDDSGLQCGQLGDGTYNDTNRPEQIVTNNVVTIAAGGLHSLFLKNDGSLWIMGCNVYGQLGDGNYSNGTNVPELIVGSNVTAIVTGLGHSLFTKRDGSLWGMGYNKFGQLGDGTYNYSTNQPEQILAPYNQISGQLLTNGDMQLSFVGIAAANYVLDWATSLSPVNWQPMATNPATSFGALVFTNTPDPATNNFWRIRSVP